MGCAEKNKVVILLLHSFWGPEKVEMDTGGLLQ